MENVVNRIGSFTERGYRRKLGGITDTGYSRWFRSVSYRHWILGSILQAQAIVPTAYLVIIPVVRDSGKVAPALYLALIMPTLVMMIYMMIYNYWRVKNGVQ